MSSSTSATLKKIRFCKNANLKEVVKRIEEQYVLSYSIQFKRRDVLREVIQQNHFFRNSNCYFDVKLLCPEFERYFFNHCHPELLYFDREYFEKRMLIFKLLNKKSVLYLSEQVLQFLYF